MSIDKTYITNEGYKATIVEYYNAKNCTISLSDGTILNNVAVQRLKNGKIKNPNHKTICGIGYIGQGVHKSRYKSKQTFCYNIWKAMICRCYDKERLKNRPTYKNVTVCKKWHNFQNFADWYYKNFNSEYMKGWHLDKDIICPDCKQYSPKNCAFVPQEINSLFTNNKSTNGKFLIGVVKSYNKFATNISIEGKQKTIKAFDTEQEAHDLYKVLKEKHVKDIAEKYKGLINNKVYKKLKNYEYR